MVLFQQPWFEQVFDNATGRGRWKGGSLKFYDCGGDTRYTSGCRGSRGSLYSKFKYMVMVTWDPQAICLKKRNDFKEKTSKNFRIYLLAFFNYFCTCYRHSSSVPGTTRCTEELRAHLPQPTPEVTTGRTTELHPGGRSSLRPLSQVRNRVSYQTIKMLVVSRAGIAQSVERSPVA